MNFQIRTIKGHLTSTNIRHIKALISQNIYIGKANRINYKIIQFPDPILNIYKVETSQNSNDWGRPVIARGYAEFEII